MYLVVTVTVGDDVSVVTVTVGDGVSCRDCHSR